MNPPDIVMKSGERRIALTEGLSLKALVPASEMIRVQDTSIVRVDRRLANKAYLVAQAPGRTRVWYSYYEPLPDNHGFFVTVIPKDITSVGRGNRRQIE